MDSGIVESIEAVGAKGDGEFVRRLFLARDRLEARLCESLVRFLAAGTHDVEGWRSPVGWLKANAAVTDRAAKRLVARAERLRQWPTLADLWFQGELTGAQVEVVTAVVPRPLVDLYAVHDAEVTPYLVGLDLADTRSALREWVLRAEAVTAPDPATADAPPEVDAHVHLSRTLAGRGVLDGDLDALTGELLETALRVVERPYAPGEFRTAAERRAESLRRMARFTLDHYATKGDRPGRQHPHLLAVIDLPDLYAAMLRGLGIRTAADLELFCALRSTSVVEEGLLRHALAEGTGAATTIDGHALGVDAVLEIFGIGTTVERLLTAEGRVLDHGQAIRLADGPLRDALLVRDQGCRFPGCDAKAEWVDAHHVEHWSAGGPTALANLAGLCASHHGVVHREGWSLTATRDGTLTFGRPDGEVLTSPPPRRRRPPPLPLRLPQLDDLLAGPVDADEFPGQPESGPLHRTGVHAGRRWHLAVSVEPIDDERAETVLARQRAAALTLAA